MSLADQVADVPNELLASTVVEYRQRIPRLVTRQRERDTCLLQKKAPLKARDIASELRIDRSEFNSFL